MDQTRKARLEAGGIMVDEALERFMGNEAMLERYLQKFLRRKISAQWGIFKEQLSDVMKTHTTQGGQLLERIPQMRELPFFTYAYDIAKYHHERWDGRGYPEGRKGDDIPLWAQIVSIADVYDALVSPRCYKKAFSFEVALGMIVSGECGVFNPNILACFREIEGKLRTLYGSGPERLYE